MQFTAGVFCIVVESMIQEKFIKLLGVHDMSIMDLIEKGKKNRQKKVREKALKNVVIGAAIGTTLGAAAGIFLAPKSGKENRDELVKAAKELPDKAREIVEKTKVKVEEVRGKMKEQPLEITEEEGSL